MQMAERAFRDTIRLKRRHKEAWVNLCLNLENSAQLQEAESAVDEAISVFPADPHFLYSRGNLLGKQRRFSEAEEAYLGAIQLEPLNHKFHGNLGQIATLSSDWSTPLSYWGCVWIISHLCRCPVPLVGAARPGGGELQADTGVGAR